MSTAVDELTPRDSSVAPVVVASVGFVALLLLALVWPAPVVWLNAITVRAPISIHADSFLGREAASWDVVFWGFAGLYVLLLFHGRLDAARQTWRELAVRTRQIPGRTRTALRSCANWKLGTAVLSIGATIGAVWLFLDVPLVSLAEAIQSEGSEGFSRLMNRFGGGMNPALVVLFFFLAGLAFSRLRWSLLAVGMAISGLFGGIAVQIFKAVIGRSRPELWLGPFHHAWGGSSSFPSGHTIGAFAIGGVIFFGFRSWPLRIAALVLASAVGVSRVLSFRHWPSDVVASALTGLLIAWIVVRIVMDQRDARSES
ncbi:MAG: phosphatase PAP2 family protein [Thermoanaerobaculia bacterium]